jgi:hypothetical protein
VLPLFIFYFLLHHRKSPLFAISASRLAAFASLRLLTFLRFLAFLVGQYSFGFF